MIIWKENQDIFDSKTDAIVNTVNTVGVMGKGLALKFKEKYPEMYDRYREICMNNQLEIGNLDIHHEVDRIIINFPTKKHWKGKSKRQYLIDGLVEFRNMYKSLNINSIAFPPLGCGNGGLEWDEVKPLMEHYLSRLDLSVEIYTYEEKKQLAEPLEEYFTPAINLSE